MTESEEKMISEIERWSNENEFCSPKNIVIFPCEDDDYFNPSNDKRGYFLSDVLPAKIIRENNFCIQYETSAFTSKPFIKKVPGVDAMMVSFVEGNYSGINTFSKRRYLETSRYFILKNKKIGKISNTGKKHVLYFSDAYKDEFLADLTKSCYFSVFNNDKFVEYMFSDFSEIFGPVAIINANKLIPFESMSQKEFIEFICSSEPLVLNTKAQKNIDKYINMSGLSEIECNPFLSSYIVSNEKLANGISVLRCQINIGDSTKKMEDVMRFYFDGPKVVSCRKNNLGEWVPLNAKQIKCSDRWVVSPIDSETCKGTSLERYNYYLDSVETIDRWSVLIASICYPWFEKLMTSDFWPVLVKAMRRSTKTPLTAILDVVGNIKKTAKKPKSILYMNNYQIRRFGEYCRDNNKEFLLHFIQAVRWVFSYSGCLSCQLNPSSRKLNLKMTDYVIDISYVDNNSFDFVFNAMERVVTTAEKPQEIYEFAACLFLIRTMSGNKKMLNMIVELFACRKNEIYLKDIKNISSNGFIPTKKVLTLYLLYLFTRHFLTCTREYNEKFMFSSAEHKVYINHISKKLDLKIETPFYSKLVEKYNIAISLDSTQMDREYGSKANLRYLFGCSVNHLDFDSDIEEKFQDYTYENDEFIVVAPKASGDIAIDGLVLNNFSKREIINAVSTQDLVYFIRRKKDIASPYYTAKISGAPSDARLVRLSGFKDYFPVGNENLLNFVDEWCYAKNINPVVLDD